MDILVLVKSIYDPVKLRVEDGNVLLSKTSHKINDIDRNALEAGLQLRDKCGGSVKALTVGGEYSREVLIESLAMGVDDVYHVDIGNLEVGGYAKAKILGKVIKKYFKDIDLILLGEASVDNYSGQTGPRLSIELNIPVITLSNGIGCSSDGLIVYKDLEGESIKYKASLPIIITVSREINTPRYVSLLKMRRAAKREIHRIGLDEIGYTLDELMRLKTSSISSITPFIMKRKNIIFADPPDIAVRKLIDSLKKEGVI